MTNLLRALRDIPFLFYPHLCLACGRNAPPYGDEICTPCRATLPETGFHRTKENPFTEKFWGRVDVHAGTALYLFTKASKVQQLIHNLKYKGKREIGVVLGRKLGHSLNRSPFFEEAELIVPVPLHVRKLRLRGYNQSEAFAAGLSESMGIPLRKHGLARKKHTSTQTSKSVMSRLENVSEVFTVNEPERLSGKHILLVDDVLTTGSTLEACAEQLLRLDGTRVSMATIAMAT